jgi:hypothetical protein
VTHPELAKEADGWDPSTVTRGSNKKLLWKCSIGHNYEMPPTSRTGQNQGCPFCSGNRVLSGFNDLSTTHPELAKEASGWDPSLITAGSGKKSIWICTKGHRWEATIANRTFHKSGCPFCSNNKVLAGFNDLQTTHPKIAQEADGWDPKTITFGSGRKVSWKCQLGHQWEIAPCQRISNGSNCPVCSNNKVLFGFNDLFTNNPKLAKEADGWDPNKVSPFSGVTKKWKCSLGHSWKAKPSDRQRGDQCPFCSGRRVLTGFNDLATSHPDLAMQADGWDPQLFNFGSNKSLSWICNLGHTWKTSPNSRTNGATGCPYCSNSKVLSGFNDLATTHPEIAKQAIGWDPSKISFGSNQRRRWICSFEHQWTVSPSVRTGKLGTGCPSCANSGFDPNSDGFLYFLTHSSWEMIQIGITNYPDQRLGLHKKLGWEIVELRGPMDGHLSQQWERAILRMLKAKGADLSNDKIAGKFDGYSEAWSKSTFQVSSIKELMRLTEEFEE